MLELLCFLHGFLFAFLTCFCSLFRCQGRGNDPHMIRFSLMDTASISAVRAFFHLFEPVHHIKWLTISIQQGTGTGSKSQNHIGSLVVGIGDVFPVPISTICNQKVIGLELKMLEGLCGMLISHKNLDQTTCT